MAIDRAHTVYKAYNPPSEETKPLGKRRVKSGPAANQSHHPYNATVHSNIVTEDSSKPDENAGRCTDNGKKRMTSTINPHDSFDFVEHKSWKLEVVPPELAAQFRTLGLIPANVKLRKGPVVQQPQLVEVVSDKKRRSCYGTLGFIEPGSNMVADCGIIDQDDLDNT